ncbi:MAG: pantoate--beta-alanine ligase [Myxococcales bacterium]|nr:pantoate--beta-alanine ligase [Myxococcales bacterium]
MSTATPTTRLHGIEVIDSPARMQQRMIQARADGKRIAFVPTMGFLHEGHVSLLKAGRERGDLLVLSIFVNPMQFGASEDLSRYPRDLDGDLRKAASAGTDLAFCPTPESMYPVGFQTRVEVTEVQKGLCGDHRPGHFAGVATVVLKLINLVQPHVLLLGEKDYQQLQVIRRMVRDLALPVEVLGCPLIRDDDGVALSSRNAYLSPHEREQARTLSQALFAARQAFAHGERRRDALLDRAHSILAAQPALRLDYLELRDASDLTLPPSTLTDPAVLLVAGFIGRTRLIDNILLAR